jgi:hypothetical protein
MRVAPVPGGINPLFKEADMVYSLMGLAHASTYNATATLRERAAAARSESGQGTVEYVALILLVAVVLAGVVASTKGLGAMDIGKTLVAKLKEGIGKVK